jgi:hypothetical protein
MKSLPMNEAMRAVDMDLIAQRIVKLAELSMLEHMEGLMRSQADSLLAMVSEIQQQDRQTISQ